MLYSPSAGSILVFLRRNQPHPLDTNYFQSSDNLNINVSNLRVKPQFSEDTTNQQTQSSEDSTINKPDRLQTPPINTPIIPFCFYFILRTVQFFLYIHSNQILILKNSFMFTSCEDCTRYHQGCGLLRKRRLLRDCWDTPHKILVSGTVSAYQLHCSDSSE